jgi:hypothetical protein
MQTEYPERVNIELKSLDRIRDGLNLGIDKNIRLLVAVLRILGFHTTGSCAGHLERPRTKGPWVDIESPEAATEVNTKLKTKPQDWWKDTETEEYKAFAKNTWLSNMGLKARLITHLEEFYKDRCTPASIWLIVNSKSGLGDFRLQCHGADVARLPEFNARYKLWLHGAQKEANDLALFLCSKVE